METTIPCPFCGTGCDMRLLPALTGSHLSSHAQAGCAAATEGRKL